MSNLIKVNDLWFEPFIDEQAIKQKIQNLADQINSDYAQKELLILVVLNGSFLFAADLVRLLNVDLEIDFIRVKSYEGTQSTGKMELLADVKSNIQTKSVLIIEDIVDTGKTASWLLNYLSSKQALELEICSLILKPDALKEPVNIKYVGFETSNEFLLGYGLDYDGKGRHLKQIYKQKNF